MESENFSFKQLQVLHQVSQELAQPGDLEKILYSTLETISGQLHLDRGMVSIFLRDVQEVRTIARYGYAGRLKEQSIFQLGEGITGLVVQKKKPIIIPRLDKEPKFLDPFGMRKGLDLSEIAFLCVPIDFDGVVVGALAVDRKSGDPSDLENDLHFLKALANLIASRLETRRVFEENRRLRETVGSSGRESIILGSSRAIRDVRYLVAQVADSKTTVLLTGETGTGKGLVAKAIHNAGPRRDQPFIKVNCGAIPENLIESELFGHEKGAFTGATQLRTGRFEAARGGTIFLDEVGELPPQAQVKLLRVLQERDFERVGGMQTIKSRARVVAATNRKLETEVKAGRFRADLYYRISVFPIHIPPLRERGADIMMLADHFVRIYAEDISKAITRIDTPAIDMMMSYHWPGNVRELENVIERAVLLAENEVIHGHLLPPSLRMKSVEARSKQRGTFEKLVAAYEMEVIVDALKDADGNQSRAAQLLGTTKRVIQYKVAKLDIDYRKFKKKKVR